MPNLKSDLVLDTSVWINLLATGYWLEIVGSLGRPCFVPSQVAAEIRRDPVTSQPYPSPGWPLIGKVKIEELDTNELLTFIDLVSAPMGDRLGDGEAAAIAMAVHRNLALVIDERKARRIIAGRWPDLPMLRSSELLRCPVVVSTLGEGIATECFERACKFGRMHV